MCVTASTSREPAAAAVLQPLRRDGLPGRRRRLLPRGARARRPASPRPSDCSSGAVRIASCDGGRRADLTRGAVCARRRSCPRAPAPRAARQRDHRAPAASACSAELATLSFRARGCPRTAADSPARRLRATAPAQAERQLRRRSRRWLRSSAGCSARRAGRPPARSRSCATSSPRSAAYDGLVVELRTRKTERVYRDRSLLITGRPGSGVK